MVIDLNYWTRVFKRIIMFAMSIVIIYISFKFAVFFMPFLIALIISLIIEPIIKFVNKKTKLTRKTSAIIVLSIFFLIIIGLVVWGIISLIFEASNLLKNVNEYYDKAYIQVKSIIDWINFDKFNISHDITNILQNSTQDFLKTISNWLTNILNGIISFVTSIPTIAIYIGITLIAIYFVCTDKLYIMDLIEYHLPKSWVRKMGKHFRELVRTLGGYLKAEFILVFIDFIVILIGLYISKIVGIKIEYPLLAALGIGFVDALPILGAGSVMMPWAIICFINGEMNLGISVTIILIIISIVRQFLEPKIVSKHISIHPIFTLIAMYTGFKFIGVFGMLIGPIVLIILKNIYQTLIEQGFVKTILDKP